PATAAHRVENAAEKTKSSDSLWVVNVVRARSKSFAQDDEAQHEQIATDPGPDHFARYVRQHVCADCAADHPGNHQPKDEATVYVASTPVCKTRCCGREHLRRMYGGAGDRRWHAGAEQH